MIILIGQLHVNDVLVYAEKNVKSTKVGFVMYQLYQNKSPVVNWYYSGIRQSPMTEVLGLLNIFSFFTLSDLGVLVVLGLFWNTFRLRFSSSALDNFAAQHANIPTSQLFFVRVSSSPGYTFVLMALGCSVVAVLMKSCCGCVFYETILHNERDMGDTCSNDTSDDTNEESENESTSRGHQHHIDIDLELQDNEYDSEYSEDNMDTETPVAPRIKGRKNSVRLIDKHRRSSSLLSAHGACKPIHGVRHATRDLRVKGTRRLSVKTSRKT